MPEPGGFIGPYQLIRELGRGTFGAVWLAERPSRVVAVRVAVKIPLAPVANTDALRAEAAVWVRASGHPNVVPVIEAEEYGGRIILVSEYVEGGAYDGWLAAHSDGTIPLTQLVDHARGILSGLAHLHERGVIHRDLKPANVLMQAGVPRLTDFGVARFAAQEIAGQTVGGSPAYMAPEAWDGVRSCRTDLWSFGVILYQIASGVVPFRAESLMPLYRQICRGEYPDPPAHWPAPVIATIRRCLRPDPSDRYATAAEVIDDLRYVRTTEEHDPANPLCQFWHHCDPELLRVLETAYQLARGEGKDRISTRLVFEVVRQRRPAEVTPILDAIPKGAIADEPARPLETLPQPDECPASDFSRGVLFDKCSAGLDSTVESSVPIHVPDEVEALTYEGDDDDLDDLEEFDDNEFEDDDVDDLDDDDLDDLDDDLDDLDDDDLDDDDEIDGVNSAPGVPSPRTLTEPPLLSNCVADALRQLGPKADPLHPLTVADLFVDVATHGTGESVARLRRFGVTAEQIMRLVLKHDLHVKHRGTEPGPEAQKRDG